MLEDLKLGRQYDGLIYLVESARNPPTIKSHHHVELELNLVVRGSISYVLGEQRHTFGRRTLHNRLVEFFDIAPALGVHYLISAWPQSGWRSRPFSAKPELAKRGEVSTVPTTLEYLEQVQ